MKSKQQISETPISFTGIARSVECYLNNREFNNFRILTLTIKDGIVTEIKRSDPYASFELMDILQEQTEKAIINLNNNWVNGAALSK